MPTILGSLKVDVPAQVRVEACFTDDTEKDTIPQPLCGDFLATPAFNWSELRSWKQRLSVYDAPKPELYDLSKDPAKR